MTTEPIILSGTTDTGTRYVQFWTDSERIHGRGVAFCHAEMNDGEAYAPHWLRIGRDCPKAWVDLILTLFPGFYAGGDIAPTHTVTWKHSVPTFHPINPEPAGGGLLDLLEPANITRMEMSREAADE